MDFKITTKSNMFQAKDEWQVQICSHYLEGLKTKKREILNGSVAVYLNREIEWNGQKLYFLYMDIDGAGQTELDKIRVASERLNVILHGLENVDAKNLFTIIATGGTGYRLVANKLVNREAYDGYAGFLECQFGQFLDMQPALKTDMPHQLLAYKGNKWQCSNAVDRRSRVLSLDEFSDIRRHSECYLEYSKGKPDPDEYIRYLERFFHFDPILDLNALGKFGGCIESHKSWPSGRIWTFEKFRPKSDENMSREQIQRMLLEKGFKCKIEDRGIKSAISFLNKKCPVCGKNNVNAFAYPPTYRLYCFSAKCPANVGLPLSKWAGIHLGAECAGLVNAPLIKHPDETISLSQAENTIQRALEIDRDMLVRVTAGAGKTYTALKHLAESPDDRIVFYSCLNKTFQKQAFDDFQAMNANHIHCRVLSAKDAVCKKKTELKKCTDSGYSPAQLLCSKCSVRKECQYYLEHSKLQPGVYFVTHAMLKFLQKRFKDSTPDLLIIDENILEGFSGKLTVSKQDINALRIHLPKPDQKVIQHILDIAHHMGIQHTERKSQTSILNCRRRVENEDTVTGLLAEALKVEDETIPSRIRALLRNLPVEQSARFAKNINNYAMQWLEGLISDDCFSYILVDKESRVSFATKYFDRVDFHASTTIKALDASGNQRLVEKITGRKMELVEADVGWNVDLIHYKRDTCRYTMNEMRDLDLTNLLKDMAGNASAKNTLILSYKFMENRLKSIWKKISSKPFRFHHFFGPRGINKYKTCDAVIAVGLPYEDLVESLQNAHFLFPDDNDVELRHTWTSNRMMEELNQCIHRIRPVRKEKVEIIVASSFCPPILPEPSVTYDQSRNADWMECAIEKIEPYVREFGFLNQDIGFLAGVCVKSKDHKQKEFVDKIQDFLSLCKEISVFEPHIHLIEQALRQDENIMNDYYQRVTLHIIILYIQNYLYEHELFDIFNSLYRLCLNRKEEIIYINSCQWTRIMNYFHNKYPFFEKHKVKLSHCRNQKISGIGNKLLLNKFYFALHESNVIDEYSVLNYSAAAAPLAAPLSLPKNTMIISMDPYNQNRFIVAHDDKVEKVYSPFLKKRISELISGRPVKTTLLTDNGGRVVETIGQKFRNHIDIHDVVMAETIIQCKKDGDGLDLKQIARKYELDVSGSYQDWVHGVFAVHNQQKKAAESYWAIRLENELIWVVAKMRQKNLTIEYDLLSQIKFNANVKNAALRLQLRHLMQRGINLLSSSQIKEYLNETFNEELISVDENAIKTAKCQETKTALTSLCEYRKTKNALDSIKRMERRLKKRHMRNSIKQIGSRTGRINSLTATLPKKTGIRNCLKARPGCKLIIADYSQYEMRILTGLSGDANSRAIYQREEDIYFQFLRNMTNLSEKQIRPLRGVMKVISLGLNYGMGERTISDKFNIQYDAVKKMKKLYYRYFNGFSEFKEESLLKVQQNGSLTSMLGRSRAFGVKEDYSAILNYPVQSAASEIFKMVLLTLDHNFDDEIASLYLTAHDEVVVEVQEDYVETHKKLIEKIMKVIPQRMFPGVMFDVKSRIADAWGDDEICFPRIQLPGDKVCGIRGGSIVVNGSVDPRILSTNH